ncbi:MAG: IS30 family transposase [Deltaproteobacteria bacterium]|nr:IS30 family transposase [Deltaproteobacteria bacterium]NND29783.1 IS30 family transposase [Myxococcales bacterium]MBT8463798.1 IS30 family transposase [Deltaproteobacteria bacterium]MBT8480757.1 IS30 family transposase [Deltaproteobacteria bacterium]NNK42759.1 IS30 family transposase [Myxococcales bacterium]
MCLEERERISRGLAGGHSFVEIGKHLGRPTSTVSREVGRNGGAHRYRAVSAHRAARRRARRPKIRKLVTHHKLARLVAYKLKRRWSPQQIAAYLRERYAEPHKRVSHETIYQCLYLQGRGGLRAELRKALRTGRAQRRPTDRERKTPVRIPEMVLISERPAEIEDRAVPGHWEGDLIIGKDSKSQVGTLVERSTRFVMLVRLPHDRAAHTVRKAITRKITHLPQALKRSLTWDQGTEMAEHARFTVATGVPVYFCDPRSPWQRGTNENTNGLLRQYLPHGTDLSSVSNYQLNRIAHELNTRPRQTLGWMTPAQKFAQLVASAP